MSQLLIVPFVVICGESLLHCEDAPGRDLAFSDMVACRTALETWGFRQQVVADRNRVVMGICRYQIVQIDNTLIMAGTNISTNLC